MSITCSLFGHKFGEEESEERREEQNGKTAIVEVSTKKCIRCGQSREEKMRTRIVDKDGNDEDGTRDNQQNQQTSGRSRSSQEKSRSGSTTGFTSKKNDYIDDEADGGVILEDNTDSSTTTGRNPDRTSTGFETEPGFPDEENGNSNRRAEDDRGVVVMGESQDDDETTEHRIVCESCTFSEVEVETSRRNGDLCPSCGGWLEVREIKGTQPEDNQDE